jgi:hypothetical protein
MVILAKDYREELRKEMLKGVIPQVVQDYVKQYTVLREDPCWRSTAFVECLGEAAIVGLDSLSKNRNTLPPLIYKSKSAADSVSFAYQMEERVAWTVLRRACDGEEFMPCRVAEYTHNVKREGWCIAE